MTNPNDQAFPCDGSVYTGMTKREYFAAQALPACISKSFTSAQAVQSAIECADLLIAELNKEK